MNSFVLILAGNLEDLLEYSFYLTYHAGIQPSEVDKLSTYEFRTYLKLLGKQLKDDRDYDMTLAQYRGGLGMMNSISI